MDFLKGGYIVRLPRRKWLALILGVLFIWGSIISAGFLVFSGGDNPTSISTTAYPDSLTSDSWLKRLRLTARPSTPSPSPVPVAAEIVAPPEVEQTPIIVQPTPAATSVPAPATTPIPTPIPMPTPIPPPEPSPPPVLPTLIPEPTPLLQSGEAVALAMNWLVEQGAEWQSSTTIYLPHGMLTFLEWWLDVPGCATEWTDGRWTISCPLTGSGLLFPQPHSMAYLWVYETTTTVAWAEFGS